MRSRHYILIAILAAALAVFLAIPRNTLPPGGYTVSGTSSEKLPASGNDAEASDPEKTSRTKSKIRDPRRKPTLEETKSLLKETILPALDVPEQSIADRVKELNRLLRESEIPPNLLTIIIDPDDSRRERPISNFTTPELRIRNIPLVTALQYMTGSTIHQFRVLPGRVEFWNYTYMPEQLLYNEKVKAIEEAQERVIRAPEDDKAFAEWNRLYEEVHGPLEPPGGTDQIPIPEGDDPFAEPGSEDVPLPTPDTDDPFAGKK